MYFQGEIRGNKGVLPGNYVEVLPKGSPTPSPRSPVPAAGPPAEKVRALYDYQPQSNLELLIKVGDVIEITSKSIGGGWWEGKLNGKTGQFPENYVEPA